MAIPSVNLDLFDVPEVSLQRWRLTLPCSFGRRAFWHRPTQAAGWFGPHHCEACATWTSPAPVERVEKIKKARKRHAD